MDNSYKKNFDENVKLPYYGIPILISYMKNRKGLLVLMLVTVAINGATDACYALFNRYALDEFILPKTMDGMTAFILVYAIFMAVRTVAAYLSFMTTTKMNYLITHDIRNILFNKLQDLSFSYFNQNSVGYIHSRLISDTARIGNLASWDVFGTVWDISTIIVILGVMISINKLLALIIVIYIVVSFVIARRLYDKMADANKVVREINSEITDKFNEGITGAKTIKTLVVEKFMTKRFAEKTSKMRSARRVYVHYVYFIVSMIAFFGTASVAAMIFYGGNLVLDNVIDISALSVFATYIYSLIDTIDDLAWNMSEYASGSVNIARVQNILDMISDVNDSDEVIQKYGDSLNPKKENWEDLVGDIKFENVSFTYPDGTEEVLNDFSLDVPAGTSVAIVGETGAGKSTLVNLACRFFEVQKGRVLIDGRDIKDRSALWLHSNIGYVLQSPHLFSGSIRENLKYGKEDATDDEIFAALDIVNARSIVEKTGKGLDAEVGEGGDLLSTGEKQLLSFARAIISDPKILVLDEATSSIDTLTEKLIQDAINRVIRGRTSFIIAHRLSTITDCDVILVVDDGKIVEQGTHDELMKKRGRYFDLYIMQTT